VIAQSERELLAQALAGLRDPLARIALALSSSVRAASEEDRVRRAESLSEALADADARIEEMLRALRGRRSSDASTARASAADTGCGDARPAFRAACERARSAALARRIELSIRVPAVAVPCAEGRVARAAVRLLRVACAWAGELGRIELALARCVDGVAVECLARRSALAGDGAQLRELLTRFALAEDARLEGVDSLESDALALCLELPDAPPC
jgi:hypothetical protein